MLLSFKRFLCVAALFGCVLSAQAQIGIPDTTPVTENFDAMLNTTTLPSHWKMYINSATPTWTGIGASGSVTQQSSGPNPTTGGTYNFGATASERAVGAMGSSSFASPNSVMAYFRNTSGNSLSSVNVSYSAERYRVNSTAASIQFYYSTDGSAWTAVTAGDVASSNFPFGASSFTFAFPLTINVPAFTITFPSAIASNGDFYLRWNIATAGSNSQGIAIDLVSVTGTFVSAANVTGVNVVDATHVDITFSEAMGTDVTTAANYTLSGTGMGTLAANPSSVALQSGNTYRLAWASGEMKIGGDVTLTASGMLDSGGGSLGSPNSATHTGGGVGTAPALDSVTRNAGSSNPTNSASIVYDAIFSEPISGLGSSNFSLATTGVSGPSVSSVSGGPTVWTVTVLTGTGSGTIRLDLANATALTDLAGNAFATPTYTGGQSFTIDKAAPTVTLSSAIGAQTNAAFNVSASTSKSTTNFAFGDVTATNATISGFTGSGQSYSFTVTPNAAGPLTVSVPAGVFTDSLGNSNALSNTISTNYDASAPSVDSTLPAHGAVVTSLDSVAITFTEPVTGVTAGALTVNGAAATGVTGSAAGPYTFTGYTAPANGTVNLALSGALIIDAAGNALANSNWSVTKDAAPRVNATFTSQSTHTLTITFNEPMGAGVTTAGNYVLAGMTPGSVSPNPASVTLVSGSTYLLTWSPGEFADDAVTLTISPNVKDTAGNAIDSAHDTISGMVPVELSGFAID